MPELPEVETVRRGLQQVTLDQTIADGEVLLARTIAYPDSPTAFLQGLQGAAIASWQRRGKYLLAQLKYPQTSGSQVKSAGWLGVHLRMTGQLLWLSAATPLQKHTRVRLLFGDRQELRFVDQRTFGQMWWVPPDQQPSEIITALARLGPEPFESDFSVEYLAERLRQRRCPIKNALLDQALIAGVGNIYADEALFRSGIHPNTLAATLEPVQIDKLYTAVLAVLQAAIAEGGTSFSDFMNVQGINGNYGGVAWVYDRKDQPCRVCATPIQRIRLAGRSSHFCPQCQLAAAP
ncbi:MAG: DNA-formamidopyrimidine glycosylase [Aphanocapsa sp. GSE-SYN-MK-11-07L]|nr:DNA-formamidopyrimidine glycosylase [Aphanocapsa sp. GSE-SYN-MK-11-07L]